MVLAYFCNKTHVRKFKKNVCLPHHYMDVIFQASDTAVNPLPFYCALVLNMRLSMVEPTIPLQTECQTDFCYTNVLLFLIPYCFLVIHCLYLYFSATEIILLLLILRYWLIVLLILSQTTHVTTIQAGSTGLFCQTIECTVVLSEDDMISIYNYHLSWLQ